MSASYLRNSGCGLTPAHRSQPLGRGDTNPLTKKPSAQPRGFFLGGFGTSTIGGEKIVGRCRNSPTRPTFLAKRATNQRGLQLETPPSTSCPSEIANASSGATVASLKQPLAEGEGADSDLKLKSLPDGSYPTAPKAPAYLRPQVLGTPACSRVRVCSCGRAPAHQQSGEHLCPGTRLQAPQSPSR